MVKWGEWSSKQRTIVSETIKKHNDIEVYSNHTSNSLDLYSEKARQTGGEVGGGEPLHW